MGEPAGSSAQRIRIGLTGLAVAFLLVLLGSVVTGWGHRDDLKSPRVADANNVSSEPLAELGVAPGASEVAMNNSAGNAAEVK
jgi:hypothetical protein